MFKGNIKYFVFLSAVFVAFVIFQINKPKPVNWDRTYLSKHKIPFGTNAIYRLLKSNFIFSKVVPQNQSVFSFLSSSALEKKSSSYLFIDGSLNFNELDSRELLSYAETGNTVFICASNITGQLADTFKIKVEMDYSYLLSAEKDSSAEKQMSLNFYNPLLKNKTGYKYNKTFRNNYFSSFDTLKTIALASDNHNHINLISIPFGKGKFIFSTTPDVFTNYFIVNDYNREYAYKTLSYIANPILYWDEHYKESNEKINSPLRFILGNDALYAAWLLSIAALLVFMIFEIKHLNLSILSISNFCFK